MRSVSRFILSACLVVLLVAKAPAPPPPDRTWMNEKNWPAFVQSRRLEVARGDDDLARLLKARYNAAQSELRNRYIYWLQGADTLPQVTAASRRVVQARLEVKSPAVKVAVLLKEQVEFARLVEKQAEAIHKAFKKSANAIDEKHARTFRLDAEVALLRAELAAKRPGK